MDKELEKNRESRLLKATHNPCLYSYLMRHEPKTERNNFCPSVYNLEIKI